MIKCDKKKLWRSYLSLVFICRENPRRSGILLFPDCPRFCRLMKTRNRRYPDRLGWMGTNLENRECSYFPDASQILRWSAIIPDKWKLKFVSLGTSAMDFAHYQSPKLLGFCPPVTQVSIFGALSISGQINRKNLSLTCGDYPIYLGRSAKSKIPDRLGFSRHMKTRLTWLLYAYNKVQKTWKGQVV